MTDSLLSRRTALVHGGLAAISFAAPALARPQAKSVGIADEAVLKAALALEEKTARTYKQFHELGLLRGDDLALCEKILANHERHASRLRQWLSQWGPVPEKQNSGTSSAPKTAEDALKMGVDMERTAMDTYLAHAADLTVDGILADAVLILVDEVKHHTALSLRVSEVRPDGRAI